jgi:hypothetical protein
MRDFVARGALYKINQQDDFRFRCFSQEVLLPVKRVKESLDYVFLCNYEVKI